MMNHYYHYAQVPLLDLKIQQRGIDKEDLCSDFLYSMCREPARLSVFLLPSPERSVVPNTICKAI